MTARAQRSSHPYHYVSCGLLLLIGLNTPPSLAQSATSDEEKADSRFVPTGYDCSFSDEFNELSLDTKANGEQTWVTYFPWTKTCPGFNVRTFPDNKNQQLWVDNNYEKNGRKLGMTVHELTGSGTLRMLGLMTPPEKLDIVDGFQYVAGTVTTQCSFWQRYGYFEGRMRFDFTEGHHWGFWLLPKEHTHSKLELDIVERVGRRGEFHRIYQNSLGDSKEKPITVVEMAGNYRDWVTYGLEWTEDEIIWYVDGTETRRVANYIHEPMYIIVSLEIGGTWPGTPTSKTQWPTVAEIDYIRAYQKTK